MIYNNHKNTQLIIIFQYIFNLKPKLIIIMKLDLIKEPDYQDRHAEIIFWQSIKRDNRIKVGYSEAILDIYGEDCLVSPPPKKSNRMKLGSCYPNAIKKMHQGFKYVEGIITCKNSGTKISHAWNINSAGKHIDFTILNTEDYIYRGIIIPERILYDVGFKNGGIWYCCLPYLDVFQ